MVQPRGTFASATKGNSSSPTQQNVMHPHLRELLRLVRRAYGVDLGAYAHDKGHKSASRVVLDPESLTPQYSEPSEADDDSDGWEED
ncbi:hypothetical protein NUW54_g12101 [Trametes sanguinea]|uniref:Uncharacterized protein n=1 Tax=Trametes sanguinea TaxID=158606 RepID=A0ACC1N2L1_9APHY|nr:hypothetical protein NUW54_g12101 [Trametes sanguinea]